MSTVTRAENFVWPYPRWIAHRGAGKDAPENTLAAFKLGAQRGRTMFECDVKLSHDGVPFLLHDATLERTTNGHGVAGHLCWQELAQLDAGRWHSAAYAGEPIPTLEQIAGFCLHGNYLLDIEIKPTPGTERITGEAVAQHAAFLWRKEAIPPLLTSFQPAALHAALHTAPQLPRALLLEDWHENILEQACSLHCVALVCHYPLWNRQRVSAARQHGLRCLSYTVNSAHTANHLLAMGADDGIVSDDMCMDG